MFRNQSLMGALASDGSTEAEVERMVKWMAERKVPPPREWNLGGFWAPLPNQKTVGHESSKVPSNHPIQSMRWEGWDGSDGWQGMDGSGLMGWDGWDVMGWMGWHWEG